MCNHASYVLTSEHEVRAVTIIKDAETPWGGMSLALLKECPEKIMSFFREVDQDKRVTLRATKVSFHRVFTFFINYVVISSPYQFSFTIPAIHVKI